MARAGVAALAAGLALLLMPARADAHAELEVTVRTSDIDQTVFETVVPVT